MASKKANLEEIAHVLKNVAHKHGLINHSREAIMRMQDSIDKDMDRVWEILNRKKKCKSAKDSSSES